MMPGDAEPLDLPEGWEPPPEECGKQANQAVLGFAWICRAVLVRRYGRAMLPQDNGLPDLFLKPLPDDWAPTPRGLFLPVNLTL